MKSPLVVTLIAVWILVIGGVLAPLSHKFIFKPTPKPGSCTGDVAVFLMGKYMPDNWSVEKVEVSIADCKKDLKDNQFSDKETDEIIQLVRTDHKNKAKYALANKLGPALAVANRPSSSNLPITAADIDPALTKIDKLLRSFRYSDSLVLQIKAEAEKWYQNTVYWQTLDHVAKTKTAANPLGPKPTLHLAIEAMTKILKELQDETDESGLLKYSNAEINAFSERMQTIYEADLPGDATVSEDIPLDICTRAHSLRID